MAYTVPYDPTYPDGSTFPADEIDTAIQTVVQMLVERLTQQFGFNFTLDPIVLTKLGTAIVLAGKNTYEPEYDGGNSGSSKTLDFTTNGTTQKFTLTANCAFTFPTAPAGTRVLLHLVQNGTGGWTPTFSGNVNYQSNIAPVILTTLNTATLYQAYSNGTVWYLSASGTEYDVS